jgi:hypothetical protein
MNNSNFFGLEPRLIEYLKRKSFYEEHDVVPPVPLEKQLAITKKDIEQIQSFQNKQKNNNNLVNKNNNKNNSVKNNSVKNNYDKFSENTDSESDSDVEPEERPKTKINFEDDSHLVECKKSKFPTQNMYDPRIERINEKMRREKEATKYRGNTANMQKSYDMYSRDFSSANSRDFEGEFSLDNIKEEINNVNGGVYEANSNFNTHELVSPPTPHQYNSPPNIQYNQQLHYQRTDTRAKRDNIQNTLGQGYTSYRKPELPRFERQNVIDLDHKVNIVSNNCRKTDLNILYEGVSELNNAPLKNIDLENYVKYGYPTSKARSLGYENPFEHQFQYIDDDIQNPDHVVFDRPMASRLENKTQKKFVKRDVY